MSRVIFEDNGGLLNASEGDIIIRAANEAFSNEGVKASAAIFAVDENGMREANREFRGIDRVTDVLSFPAVERGERPCDSFYGDILLCPMKALEQANEYGHSYERELAFLTIHGALHLMGYDHEKPDEEKLMRKIQATILERMEL